MSIILPPKINLAQIPTPLVPLDRFSQKIGGPRIWIKRDDLTGGPLTGNKVRKLEFVLADAEKKKANVLVTSGGIQSNHCRAVAIAGSQLGLKTHLILREKHDLDKLKGNLFLNYLAGASISYLPEKNFYEERNMLIMSLKENYSNNGRDIYVIPMGASDHIGSWGYINTCIELKNDFVKNDIRSSCIITANGSAGTQAGLLIGCKLLSIDTYVMGFSVGGNSKFLSEKIRKIVSYWNIYYQYKVEINDSEIVVNDQYIGDGYSIPYDEEIALIKELARTEGVILDPVYTGKAFCGMVNKIKENYYSDIQNIIFIHTGGIFGLLSQTSEFSCF